MADEDAQPVTICMEELDCANFAGWKLYVHDSAGKNERICCGIIAFGRIVPKAFLYRHLMQLLQHVRIIESSRIVF